MEGFSSTPNSRREHKEPLEIRTKSDQSGGVSLRSALSKCRSTRCGGAGLDVPDQRLEGAEAEPSQRHMGTPSSRSVDGGADARLARRACGFIQSG
jgi:hypothetical protein